MATLLERLQNGLKGRYAIERLLGEGGMAQVFLAHDLRHDRKIALKALLPEVAANIQEDRFLLEIKLIAGLSHPHIVPLFDSGRAEGVWFYAMPLMSASLRGRVPRGHQLDLDDALRIVHEIASALDFAHRHKVLHRDIKPENILFHEDVALLADFGIGKALTRSSPGLTRTGHIVGTPAYMSPEQASGDATIGPPSDIYSLGCVFYEMLAGSPPFTGPNEQAIIAMRFRGAAPDIRSVRDVPEGMAELVKRTLAFDISDRFASARDLLGMIATLQRSQGNAVQARANVVTSGPSPYRIAVLPFVNLTKQQADEYFSDGMTEEIINALANIPGLQVASRTSTFALKHKQIDLQGAGVALGVQAVVEGSVRRGDGRLRIVARLVDIGSGFHLWSETFDRGMESVFAIQEQIARAVAGALRSRLVSERSEIVVPETDLAAYSLYLRGRSSFNLHTEKSVRRSLELFQQVVAADPEYAKAYVGIADCWCRLADDWIHPADAYPAARSAALKALAIDSRLPEAMVALGKVRGWYEWDFRTAANLLREVTVVAPNCADAHWVLGSVLPACGLLYDGIAALQRALALDPLRVDFGRRLARLLYLAGDHQAALKQLEDIDPEFLHVREDIVSVHLASGNAGAARETLLQGEKSGLNVRSLSALRVRVLAAMGQFDEARRVAEELEAEAGRQYVRGEWRASACCALGEHDAALACLAEAVEAHSAGLIYLHLDPQFAVLRGHSAFTDLVSRIGLR